MRVKLTSNLSFFKLIATISAVANIYTTQILAQSSENAQKITVVIDAGHGGKDKGCTVHEKT